VRSKFRENLVISLVIAWLVFTVALISWWFIFGLHQLAELHALQPSADSARYKSMLTWEAATLILCVCIGAAALVFLVLRELRLGKQIRIFFATFAHELKTPLASLSLQVESLRSKIGDQAVAPIIERISADAARLGMQLENSLLFAGLSSTSFFAEKVRLSDVLNDLRRNWEELSILVERDCIVYVDKRAFETILKNILQNSALHGKANQVKFSVEKIEPDGVLLKVRDDGVGLKGSISGIGRPFFRPYSGSGNGLGLYIVKKLVGRMQGKFDFKSDLNGVEVELMLKGQIA